MDFEILKSIVKKKKKLFRNMRTDFDTIRRGFLSNEIFSKNRYESVGDSNSH